MVGDGEGGRQTCSRHGLLGSYRDPPGITRFTEWLPVGPVETSEVPAGSVVHTSKSSRVITISVETKIGMGDRDLASRGTDVELRTEASPVDLISLSLLSLFIKRGGQGKRNQTGRRSSVSDGPNEVDAKPVAIGPFNKTGGFRHRGRRGRTAERATIRKELDRDSRPSAESVAREKLRDHRGVSSKRKKYQLMKSEQDLPDAPKVRKHNLWGATQLVPAPIHKLKPSNNPKIPAPKPPFSSRQTVKRFR